MANNDSAVLLERVYTHWDLVSIEEQAAVNDIDDKLAMRGSIGPHEVKALKHLIRSLQNRRAEFQTEE